MTDRPETSVPTPRRLICFGCGTEFTCNLAGPCWCSDETYRLPMPVDGGDCLCPTCMRKAAAQMSSSPIS
nr:hypothetical protein [Bradyrhizobium sp.]